MIPLTLKMRNFLSYRGETPIFDFRVLHIACISGENGAGKSSFLEAMHWALWGKARVDDTSELISRGETEMSVELVFEVSAIAYRVTRTFTRERRNASKLDLSQATDASLSSWINLNGSSITETQLKIVRDIVGMSYDVFQNSAYLRQGKADAFVQLTSAARRDIIAEILEITRYEAFQKEAKRLRDELNSSIVTLRGKINDDERIAAEIPNHIALLNEHEDKLQRAKSFKVYADAVEAHQQSQRTLITLQQQQHDRNTRLATRQAEIDKHALALEKRPLIEAAYAEYQSLTATLATFEQQKQRIVPLHAELVNARDDLRTARNDAEKRIVQLTTKQENHDQLTQQHAELSSAADDLTAKLALTADTTAKLQHLTETRDALQQRIDNVQDAIRTRLTEQAEIDRLQLRIDTLQKELAAYTDTQAKLEHANTARDHIIALERVVSECRAQADALTNEMNSIKKQADALKEQRDTIHAGKPCPTCRTLMDEAHLSHAYSTFDGQLNEWRTVYAERKQQRKQLHQQLEDAEQQIPFHQMHVAQIKVYQQQLAKLDAQKQQLLDSQTLIEQSRSRYDAVASDIDTQLVQLKDEMATLDAQIQELRDTHAQRAALQNQLDTYVRQRNQLSSQLQQHEQDAAELHALQQQLAANQIGISFSEHIAAVTQQIAEIGYEEDAYARTRQAIDDLGDIQTQYGQLQTIEATSALLYAAVDELNKEIETAEHELQRHQHDQERALRIIENLKSQFHENERGLPIQQMQHQADAGISNYTSMVGRMRERLQNAENAQLRIEENGSKLHGIEQQYRHFDTLASAFSSKGIQAMLINEYALPALEQEANRLLGRMTDNQLYLSFKTTHVTKQGNNQEVLEIEVSDAVGTRPLEAFSGGEAFRISFALRIALSKLLAHRAGRRLETLIIDEGFGTQDAQGRERLVEAINSISDEFRTILVITHVSEVRDMFPTQIHIRRTNNTSQWEISA